MSGSIMNFGFVDGRWIGEIKIGVSNADSGGGVRGGEQGNGSFARGCCLPETLGEGKVRSVESGLRAPGLPWGDIVAPWRECLEAVVGDEELVFRCPWLPVTALALRVSRTGGCANADDGNSSHGRLNVRYVSTRRDQMTSSSCF